MPYIVTDLVPQNTKGDAYRQILSYMLTLSIEN